jgi:hypothetical protein
MKSSAFFASFALVTFGAAYGRADLIETASFSLIASNTGTVQGTLSLPQFNPAQGTLNSVSLTVVPTFQFVLEDFNAGAGPVSVTAQDTFSFGGIPIPAEGVFSSAIPANQQVYTFMPAPLAAGPLTENFGPNVTGFFTGTGAIPFDISLAPPTLIQFSGATTQNVLVFGGVSGTVTADYAFTPAPTPAPEPACFGVAAFGLIALGVFRRRKTDAKY